MGYDLARACSRPGGWTRRASQVKRWLARKDVGELHNLLGDIEERAGNLTSPPPPYPARGAHGMPIEEHLFDWGDNLLQLRAYDPARRGLRRLHQASSPNRRGCASASASRSTPAARYQDAVQSFCDAADLAPSDPRPYQFLGEMYGVSPEMAKEISTRLARFVETHPKNALAHFHYAMSLRKDSR